jgi:hypothetical protein
MRHVLAIAACAGLVALLSPQSTDGRGRQATNLKNIKVLDGLSEEQVDDAMFYMRGALGVQCEHCHVRDDWSSDDKDAKRTARRMIRMVRALNREDFENELAVSCYTCHRGQLKPVTTLPLLVDRPPSSSFVIRNTSPGSGITVERVLSRYLEASGGAGWSRLSTRVTKGRLVTTEPAEYPAEFYQAAPDKLLTRIIVDGTPFTKMFDGVRGWNADNHTATEAHGVELERLRRQAAFAMPVALPRLYSSLSVEGETIIDGEPLAVLSAAAGDASHRLFFSSRSGLLVRTESITAGPLGALPRRWDYEDYRRVDGVSLPFRMRETDPDFTYTWEFTSVQQNVPVDEALFHH